MFGSAYDDVDYDPMDTYKPFEEFTQAHTPYETLGRYTPTRVNGNRVEMVQPQPQSADAQRTMNEEKAINTQQNADLGKKAGMVAGFGIIAVIAIVLLVITRKK